MKKLVIIAATIAFVFLSGVLLLVFLVGPRLKNVGGSGGVDDWVARQVVRIANAYLVPEIQFDSFTYRSPGVLEMKGVRLIAPDADKSRVVEADVLRVTLAEVPKFGQPIVIERIEFERAALRFLRDAASPGASFKGLLPFVRGTNIREQDRVDSQLQLSKVLRIKRLSLRDGRLEYIPVPGAEAMRVEGLNLDMDVQGDAGAAEPGWYAFKSRLDRSPGMVLDLIGRLNVDTFAAQLLPAKLTMQLNETSLQMLPPELQKPLREHDCRGKLEATIDGTMLLTDPMTSKLNADIRVTEFNVASGQYKLPIDSGHMVVKLSEGRATIADATMKLLGGDASLSDAWFEIGTPLTPGQLSWNAQGLDLQKVLRVATPSGEPPQLAGTLTCSGRAEGRFSQLPDSLRGGGKLAIRDGRLVALPMVRELSQAMNVLNELSGSTKVEDTADVAFDLGAEGVEITDGQFSTQLIAARFTGLVAYTGELNLTANGGPLEKVQSLLGEVGKAIASVTDKIVKYHITGRVGAPEVSVGVGP